MWLAAALPGWLAGLPLAALAGELTMLFLFLLGFITATAAPPRVGLPLVGGGDLFTAPTAQTTAAYKAWTTNLSKWRQAQLTQLVQTARVSARPELAWASSAFVEVQVMIHDRFLYNRTSRRWTVDRFLSDVSERCKQSVHSWLQDVKLA